MLESLISLASRAAELFERSTTEQKRQLLAFLNTVRTERFEQVLALRPSLLAIATAAHG